MSKNIMLVLGSPNSPFGELGPIAISRLETCKQLYVQKPQKIIVTGGFGPHFNTSSQPHALYLKQALLAADVAPKDILPLVESRHSVEDATLSKWLIDEYKPTHLTVVTSDFHVERAKLIFDAVYSPFNQITFVGASSSHTETSLIDPLVRHKWLCKIYAIMVYASRLWISALK